MKLVAQRVVSPATHATGVNAYYYRHPGRDWLDAPPDDLGRGVFASKILEVEPPVGNRVRSFLEITAPDRTSNLEIQHVILDGASLLSSGRQQLPWALVHGETLFNFNIELSLAAQWDLELRILLGYALEVRAA